MLNRYFGLKAQNTTVRTEVLAGFTTFLTMAYIIVVNPAILSKAGMPGAGVAAATCIAAAFASIMMGVVANYPLALAPGMGLNAYFTFTVVLGMGLPWQTALGCVFLSGLGFLILTVSGVRKLIVEAIPRPLFAALSAGIGLFITLIGLKSAGLVVPSPATGMTLGPLNTPEVGLALFGLLAIAALEARKIRGAVLIGVVATTALAAALGMTRFQWGDYDVSSLWSTAFKLDIAGALNIGGGHGLGVFEVIFVFLFVDLFDNVGTLVAVSQRAGLVDDTGRIPRINRILIADSIATLFGSLAGTSTVVSYIESAAGVSAGGRTGLTAVVCGLLFLLALPFAPLIQGIPASATAPALIMVGALMMAPLARIDWKDPQIALPSLLTFALIPLTYSIATGLAFGVVSFGVLKLLKGEARKGDLLLFVLAIVFVIRFVWLAQA